MTTLISIITNAAFLGLFTVIVRFMFNRGLQKQKGKLDKELEKLKSDLQLQFSNEQERLNQKRNVYIDLINTMTIFIGERVSEDERNEYQKNFLKAYDVAWLWASDEVLQALSRYMQFKINREHSNQNLFQDEDLAEKEYFSECVLAIRKDLGFKETILTKEDYKFINF